MRHVPVAILTGVIALLSASQVFADTVEVKGPHICCGSCVTAVKKLLDKVEGVSEVDADAKTKTVTFTAKDADAAKAGVLALIKGGFNGKATSSGMAVEVKSATIEKKDDKVAAVIVKEVHVCCPACKAGVKAALKDSKATVTFEGKGTQLTVRVEGTDLTRGGVMEALRKAGFNGTPE